MAITNNGAERDAQPDGGINAALGSAFNCSRYSTLGAASDAASAPENVPDSGQYFEPWCPPVEIDVVIPEDWAPGDPLCLRSSQGTFYVAVPEGACAGERFSVELPEGTFYVPVPESVCAGRWTLPMPEGVNIGEETCVMVPPPAAVPRTAPTFSPVSRMTPAWKNPPRTPRQAVRKDHDLVKNSGNVRTGGGKVVKSANVYSRGNIVGSGTVTSNRGAVVDSGNVTASRGDVVGSGIVNSGGKVNIDSTNIKGTDVNVNLLGGAQAHDTRGGFDGAKEIFDSAMSFAERFSDRANADLKDFMKTQKYAAPNLPNFGPAAFDLPANQVARQFEGSSEFGANPPHDESSDTNSENVTETGRENKLALKIALDQQTEQFKKQLENHQTIARFTVDADVKKQEVQAQKEQHKMDKDAEKEQHKMDKEAERLIHQQEQATKVQMAQNQRTARIELAEKQKQEKLAMHDRDVAAKQEMHERDVAAKMQVMQLRAEAAKHRISRQARVRQDEAAANVQMQAREMITRQEEQKVQAQAQKLHVEAHNQEMQLKAKVQEQQSEIQGKLLAKRVDAELQDRTRLYAEINTMHSTNCQHEENMLRANRERDENMAAKMRQEDVHAVEIRRFEHLERMKKMDIEMKQIELENKREMQVIRGETLRRLSQTRAYWRPEQLQQLVDSAFRQDDGDASKPSDPLALLAAKSPAGSEPPASQLGAVPDVRTMKSSPSERLASARWTEQRAIARCATSPKSLGSQTARPRWQ